MRTFLMVMEKCENCKLHRNLSCLCWTWNPKQSSCIM